MSPSSTSALDAPGETSIAPAPGLGAVLDPTDTFVRRHLGSSEGEVRQMLETLGIGSVEELVRETVPASIRRAAPLALAGLPERPLGEAELLESLHEMVKKNRIFRSFLGQGYSGTLTPGVIQRNILENPGWYTQYTPYQAEISQGRLEALLNFQTLVEELTGLPIANASLLDEGTAAAEAMHLCHAISDDDKRNAFFVAQDCHPQTIAVVQTRASAVGIEVRVGDPAAVDFSAGDLFGVLLQYPATDGRVADYGPLVEQAHAADALVVVAADLLALTLLRSPGELGADVAVGSAQRFGVPMGFGGPHAAFLATRDAYKRQLPGRVIGVSRDRLGRTAYRMAMQTREQHIRREKATSNICTAQVLLAIMAGMYAVYHGPKGLRAIAVRVHALAATLAAGLRRLGLGVPAEPFFDTVKVDLGSHSADDVLAAAREKGINLRRLGDHAVGISLDETATAAEVDELLAIFGGTVDFKAAELAETIDF
jgi:glycine dehydrogenase